MWHEPITRYTLGVGAMFSLYWLCNRFIVSPLLEKGRLPKDKKYLVSTALLYLPGLGLLLLFIKDLPAFQVSPQGFGTADYIVVFMAQFFAFVLMVPFTILEIKLGLVTSQAWEQQQKEKSQGLNAVLLILVVPLMEELLCRKLLGDILGNDQAGLFLCMSAIVFSLLHLQTGRIAVAVGMLHTGFLWSWVYVSSGSLLLCTAYHILFNLLMTFIPEYMKKITSEKANGIYTIVLSLIGTTGFVWMMSKSAHFWPPELLDMQNSWQRIFGNWGFWVLAAVCVGSYILGNRAMKEKSASPESS